MTDEAASLVKRSASLVFITRVSCFAVKHCPVLHWAKEVALAREFKELLADVMARSADLHANALNERDGQGR